MTRETLGARHKRTSSPLPLPMNAIHRMNRSGSHARWKRGLRKFLRLLFICLCTWMEKREITVIPAVTAQSLLIAFWTLTCFFFPTGKPNVLAQRDWLIAWLPPHPSLFFIFFLIQLHPFLHSCLSVCIQMEWFLFKQSQNSAVTRVIYFSFFFFLGLIRHQNSSVTSIFHLLDSNKDGR